MSNDLSITAGFDRRLVWEHGDSRRYLHVRIMAPARKSDQDRPPMNLALVIDASGSMGGGRLEAARKAAIAVLDSLGEDDRLTVVSFADEAIVHVAGLRMDAAGRTRAQSEIAAVTTRGRTNLSQGWFQAVVASEEADARTDAPTRVIMLSDGHANAGITDHEQLAGHARELLARGVVTSALGIGDGYDEVLLAAIAEAGGGRLLDAEFADEIESVLIAEVSAAARTAADALHLALDLPHNATAEALAVSGGQITRNGLLLPLGSIISGAARDVAIALTLPPGRPGQIIKVGLRLTGKDPERKQPFDPVVTTASLTYATAGENTPQPRDIGVSGLVARLWKAHVLRRIAQLNAQGHLDVAQDYLKVQIRYFAQYITDIPGGADLLHELQVLTRHAGRSWSPRTRKEMIYGSFNMAIQRDDHRTRQRDHWTTRLDGGL